MEPELHLRRIWEPDGDHGDGGGELQLLRIDESRSEFGQNGNSLSASSGLSSYYAYTYDVENRIVITPSGSPGGTTYYSYAPGNKRVWRGNGGTVDELTFWSPSGQKLGTYALTTTAQTYLYGMYDGPFFYATQTGTNYYFGSKLIKNAGGWVYSDRLGSIGKFYPYGQERPSSTANGTEKFTGYFRDSETGNDYAINRYQQPGTGRFLTADGKGGGADDPGSFNKYAYAGGDPVNRVDPNGTDWIYVGNGYCSTLDDGGGCYDPGGGSCYALAAAAWMNPTAFVEECGDPTDWGVCFIYAFTGGSGCGGGGGGETPIVPVAQIQVFVVAVSDCYQINLGGTAGRGITWQRDITYEAATLVNGQYTALGGNAVISEHFANVQIAPNAKWPPESSSAPGQDFSDQISIGAGPNFTLTQTFTVTYQGTSYNAQIVSNTGKVTPSNAIDARRGYVDVNKDPNLGSRGTHPLCP